MSTHRVIRSWLELRRHLREDRRPLTMPDLRFRRRRSPEEPYLRTVRPLLDQIRFGSDASLAAFAIVHAQALAARPQAAQAPTQAKPPEAALSPSEKPAEKHSTPEDRQRLVTVAHKLEAAPLDPALA